MIFLMPMGGKGMRFRDAGYTQNKACIPTIDRHSGQSLPMVICALMDFPEIGVPGSRIICVDRDFHQTNGTEERILEFFPSATFIHDHVLLDQAFGCFLAREFLMTDEELFVGACDSGLDIDEAAFKAVRRDADAVVLTHRGDNNIARNPRAHSWLRLSENGGLVTGISLKAPLSENFMEDHATTGVFWFRSASVFLDFLEQMIWNSDTLDGKYYVDKLIQYYVDAGKKVRFLDVRLHCWGTPEDYEEYQATYRYWSEFVEESKYLDT